jgi:hypothetical protein
MRDGTERGDTRVLIQPWCNGTVQRVLINFLVDVRKNVLMLDKSALENQFRTNGKLARTLLFIEDRRLRGWCSKKNHVRLLLHGLSLAIGTTGPHRLQAGSMPDCTESSAEP